MEFLLGTVKTVENDKTFIITFTVENYIDGQIAYPLMITDEPKVGDEITLFELDPDFKSAYLYVKNKTDEFIQIRYKDKRIAITEDEIIVETPKASMTLNDDGNIELKSEVKVHIDAKQTVIEGTATPNPATPGGFCGLPNCLFTGSPHISNTVNKS